MHSVWMVMSGYVRCAYPFRETGYHGLKKSTSTYSNLDWSLDTNRPPKIWRCFNFATFLKAQESYMGSMVVLCSVHHPRVSARMLERLREGNDKVKEVILERPGAATKGGSSGDPWWAPFCHGRHPPKTGDLVGGTGGYWRSGAV